MAIAFKTNWNLIKLPNSDTSVGLSLHELLLFYGFGHISREAKKNHFLFGSTKFAFNTYYLLIDLMKCITFYHAIALLFIGAFFGDLNRF